MKMGDLSGLFTPCMDWSAPDLTKALENFQSSCNRFFEGPLCDASEKSKVDYLLIWCGEQGRDVLSGFHILQNNTACSVSLKTYWTKLAEYVSIKSNFRYARYKLHQLKQDRSEPFDQFLKRVRLIISECRYPDRDSQIIDAIICGIHQESTRLKLIEKAETLTITETIGLVCSEQSNANGSNSAELPDHADIDDSERKCGSKIINDSEKEVHAERRKCTRKGNKSDAGQQVAKYCTNCGKHFPTRRKTFSPNVKDGSLCSVCSRKAKVKSKSGNTSSKMSNRSTASFRNTSLVEDKDAIDRNNHDGLEDTSNLISELFANEAHQNFNDHSEGTLDFDEDSDGHETNLEEEEPDGLRKEANTKKKLSCKICKETFAKRSELDAHKESHVKERYFVCVICKRPFLNGLKLQKHVKSSHEDLDIERPYCCGICETTFKDTGGLRHHIWMQHTIGKQLSCPVCAAKFSVPSKLRRHMVRHVGERSHLCDVCGKACFSSGELQSHMTVHSDARPYVCSLCHKGFKSQTHLRTHEKVHSGLKPYICDVCGKRFTNGAHLNRHKMLHSGEKPYVCHLCGKACNQRSNLNIHMRVHNK